MKVWIDTDPAIGVPGCDVDDGLALLQAFNSPELEIRGVSAVFGNTSLAKAFPIARELGRRFGPPGLEVVSGAASASELGQPSDAVRSLAASLTDAPLTILALGPMTNIGSLLQRHPELAGRIESIIGVAARRPGLEFFSVPSQKVAFPDFNFECDPAAMQVVLESAPPLVFAPWEVSSHVFMTGDDLDALATTGEPGAYIARHSRDWLATWVDEFGAPGFNPFDTLAVAWLTHPELIEHIVGPAWIEPGDEPDSQPVLNVGTDSDRAPGRRPAVYCQRPREGFKSMLLGRLASRPS